MIPPARPRLVVCRGHDGRHRLAALPDRALARLPIASAQFSVDTTTDDVYSLRFAWLTHGKVGPTGLKPHDDLLTEFPYLGVPSPQPPGAGHASPRASRQSCCSPSSSPATRPP